MRAYAEAELDSLRARHDELGETLRDLIYDQKAGTDRAGLIIEIRAGTGGDEAALFARDLLEMYHRYAEQMGWKFEPLELVPTELGGFREASFGISGEGAFRHLQFESGGHRVQRVPAPRPRGASTPRPPRSPSCPSPRRSTSSSGPRTSRPTSCAGGPGGPAPEQDRERRPAHAPAQRHRRRLPRRAEPAQEPGQGDAHPPEPALRPARGEGPLRTRRGRRTLIGSGDRSQRIRTYNFPQNRVTDHRIGLTLYNLDRVILGDLTELTTALIDHDRREQLGEV